MPIIGQFREGTPDRPECIWRMGRRYSSEFSRRVDDESLNFWEYCCYNCGNMDPNISAFETSDRFHGHWVCRSCNTSNDDYDCGCDCGDPDCETCREDRAPNIHEYNYVPCVQFFRTADEERKYRRSSKLDRTPYLSFEIEVENHGCKVSNETAVNETAYDWNYAKYDGSLSSGGFEIVSHPFTFDLFRGDMLSEWQNVLISLSRNGYRSFEQPSCGMHVHISKAAFTNYHLYRFLRIWYFSRRFTFWLSRRSQNTFDMYAGFNKTGPYPIARKARDKYFPEKYESVNLAHADSVEIRIFRGTLDVNSFRRNIETVYAAFQFSDPYSADKVKTFQITPEGFAKFVKRHKKDFPELYKHFWNHGHVVSEIARETASTAKGEI